MESFPADYINRPTATTRATLYLLTLDPLALRASISFRPKRRIAHHDAPLDSPTTYTIKRMLRIMISRAAQKRFLMGLKLVSASCFVFHINFI